MEGLWPPTFSLDQERVLKLFTGDRFYSDADAALRELILNSIDAISRRHSEDSNFEPKISLTFNSDALTVTAEDSGIGMSRQDVTSLFAKVGASASNLARKTEDQQAKSIGEFGIGVVSYFLVCDSFEVYSYKEGEEKFGLVFTSGMLDGITSATEMPVLRDIIGTSVKLSIKSQALFELLQNRYQFWVRDVSYLKAIVVPGNTVLPQGGVKGGIRELQVDAPDWIEIAHIGPPLSFDRWNAFDGEAHVDILYRGVYVDDINIQKLWGIEGTIHVDPKHFKPKLNREGFIGKELINEVDTYLQSVHPIALKEAVVCLDSVLNDPSAKDWEIRKYVTLWLAIPRGGNYADAAKVWDEQFKNRKAFKLLKSDDRSSSVSILDLQAMNIEKLYVVPPDIHPNNTVLRQAVRVLRARNLPIIQGIQRDEGYMRTAPFSYEKTTDILLGHFQDLLPELITVEQIAESMLQQDSVANLYDDNPLVRLVNLGEDSVAVVVVGSEIWINIDCSAGKSIVRDALDRNEGYLGLWVACLRYSGDQATQIGGLLRSKADHPHRLGLVKRQYIRGLLEC